MKQENSEASFDMAQIHRLRRDKLRKSLVGRGLDAMLVSCAANRFYLSGFELHDPQFNESSGCLLICADGNDWLATDGRYEEAAARIWPRDHIFIYGGNKCADLMGLMRDHGARIGLEPTGVTWSFARGLLGLAGGRNPVFQATGGLVEDLRLIKDDSEIKALHASFDLNNQMFLWLEEMVKEGREMSEKELAWAIECFFRENGASELAFPTIVASGKNAALPHAIPGNVKIASNDCLLVDAGCRVDNYCSDQTRTFWYGAQPTQAFVDTLALVKEAQRAAMDVMRPGVACSDVYKTALEVFKKAGVEKHFNHGLGHGVGLETHEAPSLSPRSKDVLQKGMTVTVEPGLYYPEWGGVRWEYTVLVEENGVAVL